jgi:hypothetical protein
MGFLLISVNQYRKTEFRQKSIREILGGLDPSKGAPEKFWLYPPRPVQRFLLAATLAERAMFLSMKTRAR